MPIALCKYGGFGNECSHPEMKKKMDKTGEFHCPWYYPEQAQCEYFGVNYIFVSSDDKKQKEEV